MNKQHFITGASALAIAAFVYGWIQDHGDFATRSYVQEAKAECIKSAEDKDLILENRIDNRLNDIQYSLRVIADRK